jgi:hypothetical protein
MSTTKVIGIGVAVVILLVAAGYAVSYILQLPISPSPTTNTLPQAASSTPAAPQETVTYTTHREYPDFTIATPTGWYTRAVSASGPWWFQSTDFSNNVSGLGIPPTGNMWVEITKSTVCSGPTQGFVPQADIAGGSVSERVVCVGGYRLTLGFWNNDTHTNRVNILDAIANSFALVGKG